MGRGIGESSVKVGLDAVTFYDTQEFQYGVRDKWGYAFYQPKKDKEHRCVFQKPQAGLYIKAWEYGGHSHDFFKATRQTRSNDPYIHYEKGKALEVMNGRWRCVQRHHRLVAEVDAWRRRELLQEEMLIQLSKLRAVEKQRQHFQELRRHVQLEQLQWSRPSTADQDQLSRCNSEPAQPPKPGSVDLSTQENFLRGSKKSHRITRSAPTSTQYLVATKEDLEELDVFDGKHKC